MSYTEVTIVENQNYCSTKLIRPHSSTNFLLNSGTLIQGLQKKEFFFLSVQKKTFAKNFFFKCTKKNKKFINYINKINSNLSLFLIYARGLF